MDLTSLGAVGYRADGKPDALLVLAHGAGAGQQHPFMTAVAQGFAARRVDVVTFDFPYMRERRKIPDKAPVLEKAFAEVAAAARQWGDATRFFIGGKSMGGRISSQVASQGVEGVSGLVFLGYPLHPPGKPDQRRDAHLPQIQQPMLFVQGTRDAFGTADEIRALTSRLQRATLHAVEGGDHSFKVSGRGAPKPDEVLNQVLDTIRDWILALPKLP
jgi:uncharacterized protein